jgi:DNA/RNA-binding domain of Phe-tRNA-synthetase-like protein
VLPEAVEEETSGALPAGTVGPVRFEVAPEAFRAFPGIRLAVVVARGIDNRRPRPDVADRWRRAWVRSADLVAPHGNPQSHPRVAPWRVRLRAVGAHHRDHPASIEALLRRAAKGGEPFSIDPLVDLYNAISLEHVMPAGGFDLAAVRGPIELRATRPGDRFHGLDEPTPTEVPPGELAYCDGSTVLTRHVVWKQGREGLISGATTDVFLVSEALGELEVDAAEAVLADLTDGLRSAFGVEPVVSVVVDAASPSVTW